ncbi:GAF and ANTAR domain-containing protein [Amycolatopsis sp. EV170708-02-1]|uniref:GAF and ANTAR domain-containing protein n=1 Tax=Amycolatopsis sp. EV170708-02-1 TaxID=2919322 RepID=UPI001F0BEFA8|nr:GAF and ANTAR domain-containing protein [Amycolatopsis sp. EV170708-02-1]UMP06842.1 GAF and ANTAR domain-containing protein [Amycolatopsis sp. EV170708-02-1]
MNSAPGSPKPTAEADLGREALLARALVELANTLIHQFDVVEFLHRLTTHAVLLTPAETAGVALVDEHGVLQVIAASTEQTRLLELVELQRAEGPCQDAFATRAAVQGSGEAARARWPHFARAVFAAGFHTMAAVPLTLEDETIGALNLFHVTEAPFTDADMFIARALADIAAISLLQERALRDSRILSTQLQRALTSRITIEQAKGFLVREANVSLDDAFHLIRNYSRRNNRRLVEVARDIVTKQLPATDLPPPHAPLRN